MTNYEKIKSFTIDEMVDFLVKENTYADLCEKCKLLYSVDCKNCAEITDCQTYKDWLNSEYIGFTYEIMKR